MEKLENGYIQIYTGNGKGKTTAAVGLGVRAAGNGLKVYMVQFLKGGFTGELESIKKLEPYFKVFRFEKERGFFWTLSDDEKVELRKEIQEAYRFCLQCMENQECDVLIMDEVMGALGNKLVDEDQLVELMRKKPVNMELVLTGRNVPERIIKEADLVTEMRDIKHYFDAGVPAREGIEY